MSGFSALLYQILWQRILTLFSGGDVYAATIMVSVFMAGLGFGSVLGGHIADRINQQSAVRFFAICELGIALFAFGSVWVYRNLLLQHLSPLAGSHLSLALILFAGFLIPTVFMGMSLPFLAKSIAQNIQDAPRVIAKLYAFNTLGASLGAFITSWFLIRNFGIEQAIRFGAGLNLLCGLIAIVYVQRNKKEDAVSYAPATTATTNGHTSVFVYLLIYSLSGFLALSLEILWFRLIGVVLKASTFFFGHLLAIYLLGLAIGSLFGIRWNAKKDSARPLFLFLQSMIGVFSVFMIIVLVHAADISVSPSFRKYLVAYDPLDLEKVLNGSFSIEFLALYFLIPFLLIFPATFLMGFSYPLLQTVVQTDLRRIGRHVGWLQTASYLGSVAGAFITGLIFLTIVGTVQTFKIILIIPFFFLTILFLSTAKRISWKIVSVITLLALGVLFWRMPFPNLVWGKLMESMIKPFYPPKIIQD